MRWQKQLLFSKPRALLFWDLVEKKKGKDRNGLIVYRCLAVACLSKILEIRACLARALQKSAGFVCQCFVSLSSCVAACKWQVFLGRAKFASQEFLQSLCLACSACSGGGEKKGHTDVMITLEIGNPHVGQNLRFPNF